MDSIRGFIIFALAIVSYFLFLAWQDDYGNQQIKPTQSSIEQFPTDTAKTSEFPDTVPTLTQPAEANSDIPQSEVTAVKAAEQTQTNRFIRVKSDTLDIVIDLLGGDVVQANLRKHHRQLNNPDAPIEMLMKGNGRTFIAQSGILGKGAPDATGKRAVYSATASEYELKDGQDALEIPLTYTNAQGIEFKKIFLLKRDVYDIDVTFEVTNNSAESTVHNVFTQLKRDWFDDPNGEGSAFMSAYLGGAYGDHEGRFNKIDFDDMQDEPINTYANGGWVSIIQHYFVTAWVPPQNQNNKISTAVLNPNGTQLSILRVMQPSFEVAPSATYKTTSKLYVGPKVQSELIKLADGLDLSVDYGILWWIGQPLFYLLILFQGVFGNWGLSIIFVTLTVKIILFPIFSKQYRSFAKLRLLAPKIEQLKQRYGDDKAKMGPAMMELYKKEKANPLGGCVPMLITMPVFFALYWVLMESIEIRHQPFFLWIHDLSSQDPYFILPLIMGASMFLMQKMQPTAATMDPMQQKMMQFMPVIFTVFFLFFPSGLVLYWIVNNCLSIAQQVFVTKRFEAQHAALQEAKGKK
jgi:YidC/Oxa1 family membrane protein insertase